MTEATVLPRLCLNGILVKWMIFMQKSAFSISQKHLSIMKVYKISFQSIYYTSESFDGYVKLKIASKMFLGQLIF